jgi:hypothetical protein
MMHKIVWAALALALAGGAFPVNAQQADNAQMPELAFMPSTMTVTLLNEGGSTCLSTSSLFHKAEPAEWIKTP